MIEGKRQIRGTPNSLRSVDSLDSLAFRPSSFSAHPPFPYVSSTHHHHRHHHHHTPSQSNPLNFTHPHALGRVTGQIAPPMNPFPSSLSNDSIASSTNLLSPPIPPPITQRTHSETSSSSNYFSRPTGSSVVLGRPYPTISAGGDDDAGNITTGIEGLGPTEAVGSNSHRS